MVYRTKKMAGFTYKKLFYLLLASTPIEIDGFTY